MSTPAPTSKNATRQRDDALTERQHLVLDAIRKHIAEQGFAPSFREIGEAVGLKSRHRSSISFMRWSARAIFISAPTRAAPSSCMIPARTRKPPRYSPSPGTRRPASRFSHPVTSRWSGASPPGVPITAEQHIDDVMRLPQRLTGSGKLFMLEVHGDSMIDAAICDGDYVVIREQPSAVNGDIVAALLDDEATIKTFRKDNGHIWLIPHNPAYSPIDGTHAQIMGKVVSVLRRL